ncbi:phosphate butyryltransferase [Bacillus sp. M6-12]|uniref:phosphate butyryltransferase n=1 Tax=Bacillus sp. M6-12 TaxID=2054166 RepID=UPI000C78595B|nr:phosphate butyryltransferase [Bacillus sp. M6-12]PLS15321.1 phosphate butyryltransferase [Bacillus sp. M6-12]
MKLQTLVDKASQCNGKTVAVAAAEDYGVIQSIVEAVNKEIASFLLFGNKERIVELLESAELGLSTHHNIKIIHSSSASLSAEQAVRAVKRNEANVLMKGNIPTAQLLKAVLNKEYGMRTGNILSHTAVFEVPGFKKFMLITDSGINISPDLEQKRQIIQNSVRVARSIGIEMPKVAPLAAVEAVNPAMQATLDAAALTVMNARGQITDCIVDGPLALDNAVSAAAAEHKGISGSVAGQADILLVPSIETGNILYKSFVYFAKAKVGGIIAGASAPIVLTSRSDSAENKLYSLALAVCFVQES